MLVNEATEAIPLSADQHGVIRVSGTRVTLDTLVDAFREGATPEEMAQQYPSVPLADIYHVIGYYLRHSGEVESYLHERSKESQRVRQINEQKWNPIGIRARLLARSPKRVAP